MPQTITPLDILTSSGRYPDREASTECSSEVRAAAADLAERVSGLLDALLVTASVSSGFRSRVTNGKVRGAKMSAHMSGQACDLLDRTGDLARAIAQRQDLLERYDLYLESPQHTPGWAHLQSRKTASGNRVFLP